jgi:DNA-binding transcriptional ArsR family regulator
MRVATEPNVFHAIADATRRRILDLLRDGDRPVQELVSEVDVTFGAVSQHLKTLREAGLVSRQKDGRRRIYHLRPEALKQVHDWTAVYEKAWRGRFWKLRAHLEKDA